MSLKENLERLRKLAGLSQTKLAVAANVSQQLISRLENGTDLTTKKLPEIARALSVSVYELDENYAPDDGSGIIGAPLISWVNAGAFRRPEVPISDLSGADKVYTLGLDPEGEWIALKVEGDSMDLISPPDSIVFVNLKDRRLVANACYVIADEDGSSTYKRYRPNPTRWEPVSLNKRDHETFYVTGDRGPRVIGRVKRTVLDL